MFRHTLVLLAALVLAWEADAQTTHTITVGAASFSPSQLPINVGDRVRWVNNNTGFHNVNGSAASYPSNPEGFIDSQTTRQSFEFEFTFVEPGTYGYHCDEHGTTTAGMRGTIVVTGTTSVEEEEAGSFEIQPPYPNPFRTSTSIEVSIERPQVVSVAVFDAAGREVALLFDDMIAAGTPKAINWTPSDLPSGLYAIRLRGETFTAVRTVVLSR
jgi:plastocyanin